MSMSESESDRSDGEVYVRRSVIPSMLPAVKKAGDLTLLELPIDRKSGQRQAQFMLRADQQRTVCLTLRSSGVWRLASQTFLREANEDVKVDERQSLFEVWILLYAAFVSGLADSHIEVNSIREDAFSIAALSGEPPKPAEWHTYETRFSRSVIMQQFRLVYDFPPLCPHIASQTKLKHPDPIPDQTVVRRHPLRPPTPGGIIYSRALPHINAHTLFNLRPIAESDAKLLAKWMNDPRVNEWWGEASDDMKKHEDFVKDRIADKHTTTVIGSFVEVDQENVDKSDVQDAVYSEIYWVQEDRLGIKIEQLGLTVDLYDRGIHQLVGSNAHRGPHRVRAWLPSLVHYCFVCDPRTKAVWCEPNEKNAKMCAYLYGVGFERVGTVYFSHKTSALLKVTRERFYELDPF